MNCGLGIRPELFAEVVERRPDLGFLEAHSENYFGESIARAKLLDLRENYPISLHGVGLSLGRADDLNEHHLSQLKKLVDDVDPFIVSEHLAWSAYSHRHIPDLLPLPLTEQALDVMCDHVDKMQQTLGRQVLIENPSNYLVFDQLQIPEPEFLNAIAGRTGCGLLIDVNNIHVSAMNVGRCPLEYIRALDADAIAQYHLAGYTEVGRETNGQLETLLIDTHNQTVYDPVWKLFENTIEQHGVRPTLFEWDSDFPEFEVLIGECEKANQRMAGLGDASVKIDSDNVMVKVKSQTGATHTLPLQTADDVTLKSQPRIDDAAALAVLQNEFLDDIVSLSAQHTAVMPAQQHRISVYQNNFFGAMQDYLAEVYPATQGVVGDEFFKQMVQVLLQLNPPSDGNVHNFGRQMYSVVERFDGLTSLPYLRDLIDYEWALHHAYYSEISDAIDPSLVPQEVLLTMDVEFNASVTLIDSDYPIYEIHRQSLPSFTGDVVISLDQSCDTLLIYKQGYDVGADIVGSDLNLLLLEIKKVNNLLQAIEALSGSIESHELSTSLGFLFEKKLLKPALTAPQVAPTERPSLH